MLLSAPVVYADALSLSNSVWNFGGQGRALGVIAPLPQHRTAPALLTETIIRWFFAICVTIFDIS